MFESLSIHLRSPLNVRGWTVIAGLCVVLGIAALKPSSAGAAGAWANSTCQFSGTNRDFLGDTVSAEVCYFPEPASGYYYVRAWVTARATDKLAGPCRVNLGAVKDGAGYFLYSPGESSTNGRTCTATIRTGYIYGNWGHTVEFMANGSGTFSFWGSKPYTVNSWDIGGSGTARAKVSF